MKYILYKDGSGLCKTREKEVLENVIQLQFLGDGSEIRVGIFSNGKERFYSITNGAVILPATAFCDGENKITVYSKNRLWKCESLILNENELFPAGCDSTEQIAFFKSEYEKLQKRLFGCEMQISRLEKIVEGNTLFN